MDSCSFHMQGAWHPSEKRQWCIQRSNGAPVFVRKHWNIRNQDHNTNIPNIGWSFSFLCVDVVMPLRIFLLLHQQECSLCKIYFYYLINAKSLSPYFSFVLISIIVYLYKRFNKLYNESVLTWLQMDSNRFLFFIFLSKSLTISPPTAAGVVPKPLERGCHDAGDQQDQRGAAGPSRGGGGTPGPHPGSDWGRRWRRQRPSAHTKDVQWVSDMQPGYSIQ